MPTGITSNSNEFSCRLDLYKTLLQREPQAITTRSGGSKSDTCLASLKGSIGGSTWRVLQIALPKLGRTDGGLRTSKKNSDMGTRTVHSASELMRDAGTARRDLSSCDMKDRLECRQRAAIPISETQIHHIVSINL